MVKKKMKQLVCSLKLLLLSFFQVLYSCNKNALSVNDNKNKNQQKQLAVKFCIRKKSEISK